MGTLQVFHKDLEKLLSRTTVFNYAGSAGAGDCAREDSVSASCRFPGSKTATKPESEFKDKSAQSTELKMPQGQWPDVGLPKAFLCPSGGVNPVTALGRAQKGAGSRQDRQKGSWKRCWRGKEMAELQ